MSDSKMPMRCGHVAVVGRTNAGKSTLVNQIVGEKISIVSPVPQTTRNVIIGVRNGPGYQLVLVDTPGFHVPQHEMNRRMVDDARGSMTGVDGIVLVVDASDRVGSGDEFGLDLVKKTEVPFVIALNKLDRIKPKERLLPLIERFAASGAIAVVPISAAEGTQVDDLLTEIARLLPESPAIYPVDITTDQTERFLVAELIREKILLATREEVPHATVVLVERVEEKQGKEGKPLLVVEALVAVEKENQKAILIGKGGAMLKSIGMAARLDIEAALGLRCHLALTVGVKHRWRDDAVTLDRVFQGTRALIAAVDFDDSDNKSGEEE